MNRLLRLPAGGWMRQDPRWTRASVSEFGHSRLDSLIRLDTPYAYAGKT